MKPKKYGRKKFPAIIIRPFRRSDLSYVISGQLALYAEEYGFTSDTLKDYLAEGVRDFAEKSDSRRDCMFIAMHDRIPCGCIAITHTENATAQLRFYFIEKEMRGNGAGRRFIDRVIGFCRDAGYERVFLWTISTLDAARYQYAGRGFRIADTQVNNE